MNACVHSEALGRAIQRWCSRHVFFFVVASECNDKTQVENKMSLKKRNQMATKNRTFN